MLKKAALRGGIKKPYVMGGEGGQAQTVPSFDFHHDFHVDQILIVVLGTKELNAAIGRSSKAGDMNILFLCVANSARSQMAEGIARRIFGPGVVINSAGSQPSTVNPLAIQVMSEIDIDISKQRSKSVSEMDLKGVDLIVTLCREEVCPAVGGTVRKQHWALEDPASTKIKNEERLGAFRATPDELVKRISNLKESLQT